MTDQALFYTLSAQYVPVCVYFIANVYLKYICHILDKLHPFLVLHGSKTVHRRCTTPTVLVQVNYVHLRDGRRLPRPPSERLHELLLRQLLLFLLFSLLLLVLLLNMDR
jgi:hypothetical protein